MNELDDAYNEITARDFTLQEWEGFYSDALADDNGSCPHDYYLTMIADAREFEAETE